MKIKEIILKHLYIGIFVTIIFSFGCRNQMSEYKIFCGISCPDGKIISAEQWLNFRQQYIIPEFSEGFTVIDGQGCWQDDNGCVIQEDAKIILIIAENSSETESKILRIANAYRQSFNQECVIILKSKSEVTFVNNVRP